MLVAQKTGLDYLQRLILKSKKDFKSNAMLYISEKVGLPHLANPPDGMMIPSVPSTYMDKCKTDLLKISTISAESQASLYSKVRIFCNIVCTFCHVILILYFSCTCCRTSMLRSIRLNDFRPGRFRLSA